jgi:hypothetical protein
MGWTRYRWAACVPPIFVILGFKMFLTKQFDKQFRFYCPTDEELRNTKQHTKDERRNYITNRFGHPALHAELFTPMVHADQVHLLDQVYSGHTSTSKLRVKEMGGQKVDAVSSGGITFAAIKQVAIQSLL